MKVFRGLLIAVAPLAALFAAAAVAFLTLAASPVYGLLFVGAAILNGNDAYSDGHYTYSTDSGSTWLRIPSQVLTYDLMFEEWGYSKYIYDDSRISTATRLNHLKATVLRLFWTTQPVL